MKLDRDLLAEWAGEELVASARAAPAVRAEHAARSQFYLDVLRGRMEQVPLRRPQPSTGRSGAAGATATSR